MIRKRGDLIVIFYFRDSCWGCCSCCYRSDDIKEVLKWLFVAIRDSTREKTLRTRNVILSVSGLRGEKNAVRDA